MKALVITTGSRGDVQPFIALAAGLNAHGHEAVVAAPRRFEALSGSAAVPFVGLDDSIFALQEELSGSGVGAALTGVRRARPYLRRWLSDLTGLVDVQPNVIVCTRKTLGGTALAERLGVPVVPAQLIPLEPATAQYPIPLAPAWWPSAANKLSWRVSGALEAPWRSMVAQWRIDQLGLSARGASYGSLVDQVGVLSAWSPHLLPAPADWPAHAAPLGFWTLPGPVEPLPDALGRFLDAGEPPVLMGFGSMLDADPARLSDEVIAGLRMAGRRGVVVSGWAGLGAAVNGDDIFVVDQADYRALLPRVAVAVHHGGVGTAAAALTAGIPQVVRPYFGDQPFWASRLHAMGVAPAPLGRLRSAALAERLTQAVALAPTARQVADRLAGEDGVAAAVDRLERLIEDH